VNPHESTHHLTYERKYSERVEDLQGICNGCHEFIHGKSDFDPSIFPPVVNGKIVKSFYLAGKITGTTWRDSIVPGWSKENHSMTYHEAVLEPQWRGDHEWDPVLVEVSEELADISYLGPWWCELAGESGGHGHVLCMSGPHASISPDLETTNAEKEEVRADVSILVHRAILGSDLIFAWVDSEDCFGTVFELGLAEGIGKTIVFASPPSFDASELWLSSRFAHYRVLAPSPLAAWKAFWNRQDVISWPVRRLAGKGIRTIVADDAEGCA